jgi:hypothetical protein
MKKFMLLIFLMLILVGCIAYPLRIQHDVVPAESLHAAEVIYVATRNDILKAEAYKAIITAGVNDSELVDGSIVMGRVYCCGGISVSISEERIHAVMVYVPKGLKVKNGDFIEFKVGCPPTSVKEDVGLLNTVTRVIKTREELIREYNDPSETCWWDPRDERLWLRVIYCKWMPKEGWIEQRGSYRTWYKPKADN